MSECPICTYHFHNSSRKPRRMPCCITTTCEVCLQNCIDGSQKLSCPFCRYQHHLPDGIESLPVATITCSFTPKLDEKNKGVKGRIQQLSHLKINIVKSKKIAINQITSCFEELMEELQYRKAILLSQVDLEADQKQKSVDRALVSHNAFQLKLKKATCQQSAASVDALLKESPEDVGYDRLSVSFIPAQIQQLRDTINSAGQVRTVDFRPKDRPDDVPETDLYNAIHIQPDDIPQVSDVDKKIPGCTCKVEIICPHLEWDKNTASSDVTVSGTEISNTETVPPPPDTGCRIQAPRRVLATRPVVIRRGQWVMYQVKVRYSIKQVTEQNRFLFESALTTSPVDTNCSQPTGLSVQVATCSTHKQHLCLQVWYDDKRLTDIPLSMNQVGESRDLHLCFVLDGDEKRIHVVDKDDVRVVQSVTCVRFDRPLWVMNYVGSPDYFGMTGELVSGNKVTVTQEITQLLSCLH